MAALNGYFDCVQLLLDIHANVSAVTFHYGTTMDLIGLPFCLMHFNLFNKCIFLHFILMTVNIFLGAGSTPLHYAACGGNLKCCQARIIQHQIEPGRFFTFSNMSLWYFQFCRYFLQEVLVE